MNATELTMPVVLDWRPIRNYPFEALSPEFVSAWKVAEGELPDYHRERSSCVLLALECLLQITGRKAPAAFNTGTFTEHEVLFKQLHGALHSQYFFGKSHVGRSPFIHCLMHCRSKLAENLGSALTWCLPISTVTVTPEALKLCDLFEAMELDPTKVLIWQGWPCLTKSGKYTFCPMMPIYTCLGEEFAREMYELTRTFLGARQDSVNHAVSALSGFLAATPRKVTIEKLKDPAYVQEFMFDMYEHWLRDKYKEGKGVAVARIVHHWRGQITSFFYDYVFPSGLIAKPAGAFPTPRSIPIAGDPTNIKWTEKGEVHDKLLTPVPLNVTDDEALRLIFIQIRSDLDSVRNWAWSEVKSMAERLERRGLLAARGGVRKICKGSRKIEFPTDWNHPDHLANGAATFEYYGYPNGREVDVTLLFPGPRSRWTEELAIPTSGALLPHCAVVVLDHPQVTAGFLDSLELYDKNGKMHGLIPTDSGEIVYGTKLRRGPSLAAQDIHLTANAAFALNQIVRLTQPLRDFLRNQGDDDWRYLLLTSSGGFGYPKRASKLPQLVNAPGTKQKIAKSASKVLGLSQEDSVAFAQRFTLSAVRASAAVVVYIESRSMQEMSKALGHAQFQVKLLDRYLPKEIRDFFQERWVRIFQEGVIVQAMQGSKYLLRASSFSSIEELDKFLCTHSLKIPSAPTSSPELSSGDPWLLGELHAPKAVVFGLNEEILTILLSLEMAYRQAKHRFLPKAIYWADLTSALIPYVVSAATKRPDIRQYLIAAQAKASAQLVEHIAYAPA